MSATTSTAYEAERHVSRRCPRMDAHHPADRRVQPLPVPCEDCYSIESVWRRIPYEPDGRTTVTVQQVENGRAEHAHGKLTHAHAHADVPHGHMLRAICRRPECEPYPTHDIHPGEVLDAD